LTVDDEVRKRVERLTGHTLEESYEGLTRLASSAVEEWYE